MQRCHYHNTPVQYEEACSLADVGEAACYAEDKAAAACGADGNDSDTSSSGDEMVDDEGSPGATPEAQDPVARAKAVAAALRADGGGGGRPASTFGSGTGTSSGILSGRGILLVLRRLL